MRVLFIGDSLIKGSVGVNWVKMLAKRHPDWDVENAGVNSETITNISNRLKKKICTNKHYDTIVLLAGANDILIPSLEKRGFFFRRSYRNHLRKGNTPLKEPENFSKELRQTICFLKDHTSANIVLGTISCLNEDLQSPLNKRRQQFNAIIRDMAIETGCRLADAAALCDGCLLRLKTKDYFQENFFNTLLLDKIRCRMPGRADALSKKRDLHLTVDGLHLNSQGARFYIEEVERQIY